MRLHPFRNDVKNIFSAGWCTSLVILVAVIARFFQLLFFYNIRVDASYQVMATDHLLHGHGVSFAQVHASNLAATDYTPLVNWPPGYSLLLAPFYWLADHNYIWAGISLDITCAVLLIIIGRGILKELAVPLHYRNLFTLLTSFFIYSFYFIASSDAIAIAFFATAIYIMLRMLNQTARGWQFFLLIFCLVIAAWTKYLFIPVVFAVPLVLLLYGWRNQLRGLTTAGWTAGIILLLAVTALLIYQKAATGTAAYISEPQRGFFPEHLKDLYPFFPAALVRPDSWQLLLPINDAVLSVTYKFIHIAAIVLTCILYARFLKKELFRPASAFTAFLHTAFWITAGITLLLALLSLRVGKEEIWPGTFWTYIEETRYYGMAYVLIHISLFTLWYHNRQQKRLYYFLMAMVVLLSLESFRGFLFTGRRVMLAGKETYSWQTEKNFQQYADSLIQHHQEQLKVSRTIVAGSSYYMNHRISLASHVPILYDAGQLNTPDSMKTTLPVLIMAVIENEAASKFQPFLNDSRTQLAGSYNGFYFYTFYARPH